MDKQTLKKLYDDVSRVLFDATLRFEDMTAEQIIFAKVFEQTAVLDLDVLETYSDFVDTHPDASLEQLHSFCLGASLGKRYQDNEDIINRGGDPTTH